MALILRPKHIEGLWAGMGFVDRTPQTYRQRQTQYLKPNPAAVEPFPVSTPINAFIGGGAWRVSCRCGEAPHADPDWRLSCCFGCGAIYEDVRFPDNWADIERLLVKRPVVSTRNWREPETFEQLVAEQIAHGDPV